MKSPGLRWLAWGEWAFCLVFVRGVAEDQVFRAFGADPGEAVPRRLDESLDAAGAIPGPAVWVGQAGEWLEAVLSLAERAFRLSLDPADLDRPLRCARILPVLEDLPRHPPANQVYRTGDPVIDLLMSRADPQVAVRDARSLLAIRVPETPSHQPSE